MQYRNPAYNSRIQLAVLDHNLHAKRALAKITMESRCIAGNIEKDQKVGCNTICKEPKKYEYFTLPIEDIIKSRTESSLPLKHKEALPTNHPRRIQDTVAHQPPDNTKE